MGKSNSKYVSDKSVLFDTSDLKGCAKIMCEKHGKHTCDQLPLWVEGFGFPENGSFSVRVIQQLQEMLEEYDKMEVAKYGGSEVDWGAFLMWRMETEARQRRQEKGRRRRELRLRNNQPQQDLLPASAAAQRPRDQQPAQPHVEVRGQPSVANPESTLLPYRPSADEAASPSTLQLQTGSSGPTTPQTSHGIEIYDPSDRSAPRAVVMYVYRAWMPEELRSVAAEMPDVEKRGGAAFVEALLQVVQLYKPSLGEIRSLLLHSMKLKLVKLQVEWPLADVTHDWTAGSTYRECVQDLCEKIKTTFTAKIRFDLILDCTQKPGETVDDYLTRFTEVFEENCGSLRPNDPNSAYSCMLKFYFMQGLDEEIGKQIREKCIGWELRQLSYLRACAADIERKMRLAEEKRQKAKEQLAERLQKEVLRSLQGANRRRAGRGDNRCWSCGAPGHFARDCYRG